MVDKPTPNPPAAAAAVETAPDPEEDDLDDLDDVLDEFSAQPGKPTLPSEPKPSASGPGRPPLAPSASNPSIPSTPGAEEALAAQLQAGMANLISELGESPDMQAQFEDMMAELVAAGKSGSEEEFARHVVEASEKMPAMEDKKAGEADFQSTIRKTMERMQASGDAATAAAAEKKGPQDEEEMLMELLKGMGGMDGAGGEGSEEDFNTMLMGMMKQLTNKEILYEPMKELDEKFPGWMEKNKDSTKADDLQRYNEQQKLVGEIVGRFESRGYSDENEDDREFIVERMQKMQAAGSPPPDLVGDMSAAQEALGALDSEGCAPQ